MGVVYFVQIVSVAPENAIEDLASPPRFDCDTIWDEINTIVQSHTKMDTKKYSKLIYKEYYEYMIFETMSEDDAKRIHHALDKYAMHDYILKSTVIQGKQ